VNKLTFVRKIDSAHVAL